ncbi:translation elongation factor 1-alpha [Encephalitozoon intestinalis ATCC 50506]|uniref:Translation elongation factor 1-alpha n=1 Tax=Encephalitozoon intestinalis (strain ATCC 50506) TaxID=876142 RepID=E0S7R6_ENCIT|nr:translation elongation factor 1-alpha [Encephalitozoon intestinalis ATCC 50506]ADM11745.1 translation elongation factor 1-alpha [Encephalitozoon intestinalis ATCC 50506]UTX45486.1 translation elongation factor EF-1 alpha [Encephalitozoon intestinalis]
MDLEKVRISQKKVINIVFVGHVDAGKSTICGQILVQMGLVDPRTLEKYKEMSREQNRESWYLSWCLDINPEERERGKTTEVGTASFELPHRRINILDAPGHNQFVFEMINGANRADVGILVISARINEFEAGFEKGGQTREHIFLLKAGSVQRLIVLVNKMDDPSVGWNKSRFDEIKDKVSAFVRRMFPVPVFIPVSGFTGEYIKDKGSCPWYDGESFLSELDKITIPRRSDVPLAITVTEKVKLMGMTILYGKVECGKVTPGMPIKILPHNTKNFISSIMDDEDVEIEEGNPGDVVKLKLKEDPDDVSVGTKILDLNNMDYRSTQEFTCGLNILDVDTIISSGYTCILHVGIATVQCKIKEIRDINNKKIRFCRHGSKVLAKIVVSSPICVFHGNKDEEERQRFALRLESKTIAVGVIRTVKE